MTEATQTDREALIGLLDSLGAANYSVSRIMAGEYDDSRTMQAVIKIRKDAEKWVSVDIAEAAPDANSPQFNDGEVGLCVVVDGDSPDFAYNFIYENEQELADGLDSYVYQLFAGDDQIDQRYAYFYDKLEAIELKKAFIEASSNDTVYLGKMIKN